MGAQNAQAKRIHARGILEIVAGQAGGVSGQVTGVQVASRLGGCGRPAHESAGERASMRYGRACGFATVNAETTERAPLAGWE